jgi:hypothetical protein
MSPGTQHLTFLLQHDFAMETRPGRHDPGEAYWQAHVFGFRHAKRLPSCVQVHWALPEGRGHAINLRGPFRPQSGADGKLSLIYMP